MHRASGGVAFVYRFVNGLVVSMVLASVVTSVAAVAPPGADEELDAPTPGLLASFTSAGGRTALAVRVVSDLSAHWAAGAPDARVPADGFVCRYNGKLLIQAPGRYTFYARTDGAVALKLAGQPALEGSAGSIRTSAVEMPAGFAALFLEYRHGQGEASLAIDWEGPGFAREPLPARLLYHEPGDGPRPDRFEDGRRLADRLGCRNCHTLLDLPRHPHLGPPLGDAATAIAPDWLENWLTDPTRLRARSRMPAFGAGLKPAEVADLTAFLASAGPRPREMIAELKMALNVASPARGRLLFRSVGCLGCHTQGDVPGIAAERFAPDLADLGRKRSETWLAGYLHHPKKGTPSPHRADLRISADEAAHLAAYLVNASPAAVGNGDRQGAAADRRDRPRPRGDRARGKELAQRLRCAACHELAGLEAPRADLPLTAGSRADAGCLADLPTAGSIVPHYALNDDERQALRAFVAGLPGTPSATSPETLAGDVVRRLNCLGCHVRDGQGGQMLGPQLAAFLASDPELGSLKGTLTPPDLSAVGAKLRPEYLDLAVHGAAPAARPWLSVRMPTFAFEPRDAQAIAAYFQGRDRMETKAETETEAGANPSQPPRHAGGATFAFETAVALLGQRGFGCVNCHVLAGKIPPGGEPETLGPDLALAHRRMTESYFNRWIGNPQRIIPGTPMPQFLQPVATLPGTIPQQLSTLWALLGSTRIAEAAAQGTREVLKRQGDRAAVVRDMVLMPGAPGTEYTPRALAIGLKNDHTLLFDTDRINWLAFWHRGFLSRTKSGRLWEWHPEGDRLWVAARRRPPVVFVDAKLQAVLPREERGRFGHFTELGFSGPDVILTYALNPPQALAQDGTPIEITEAVRPTAGGWERAVRVGTTPLPSGLRPALVIQPADVSSDRSTATFAWNVGNDRVTLRVRDAQPVPAALPDDPAARLFVVDPATTARIELAVQAGR